MGEGEYVMGLEPCNCYVGGRADAKQKNTMEYLKPGEVRNFDLTIELLNGAAMIDTLVDQINSI